MSATPKPLAPAGDSQLLAARDSWSVLESLLQNLSETSSTTQSVTYAVEAARVAVGADVAYWFSKSNEKISGVCAKKPLSTERAVKLAKALMARLPSGSESVRWVRPEKSADDGQPTAAVMAADARTQGCIVALSFEPKKTFEEADTKAVRMAMKMLLALRAQSQASTKILLTGQLQTLTTIVDAKDPYTVGHSERVARIAVLLVKKLVLPSGIEGDAYLAGLLHDVGNLGIPDQILHRPKRLTVEELAEVRRHPVIGEQIVASMRPFDRLRPAVRHHHEHFNGGGYPDGLAGDAIPILARVLAVAEACDAMMSPRRYRAARSPFEIDAVFTAEAGHQFDPQVVKAFMAVRQEIYPAIYSKGIGESAFQFVEYPPDEMNDSALFGVAVMDPAAGK